MVSPQSPPDENGQAKRNLPNSSAPINPCGRRFGVYALANGQPFLVLGFFIFGIIQLEDRTRRGGVVVCIQGLGGEIRGVHSAWFANASL